MNLEKRFPAAVLLLTAWLLLTPFLAMAEKNGGEYPAEVKPLIEALETAYSGRDVTVDFHQKSTLKAIDITEEAFGRARFSHPGKMNWEYLEPEHNSIITDGVKVWIYRPQENQVVTGNAADFFRGGAGAALMSDISRIKERFAITPKTLEPGYGDLLLVPLERTPDIESVVLRVDRKSGEILRITTTNLYGDTTELAFSNARFGSLDPSLFTFTPPEGADVMLMNP